jgi:hypothetical protein
MTIPGGVHCMSMMSPRSAASLGACLVGCRAPEPGPLDAGFSCLVDCIEFWAWLHGCKIGRVAWLHGNEIF